MNSFCAGPYLISTVEANGYFCSEKRPKYIYYTLEYHRATFIYFNSFCFYLQTLASIYASLQLLRIIRRSSNITHCKFYRKFQVENANLINFHLTVFEPGISGWPECGGRCRMTPVPKPELPCNKGENFIRRKRLRQSLCSLVSVD